MPSCTQRSWMRAFGCLYSLTYFGLVMSFTSMMTYFAPPEIANR